MKQVNIDHKPKAVLFLDFDGTISRQDAVDAILEGYADPKWREFEKKWQDGRIGSRDCLQAQMSLVCATRSQVNSLVDEIALDQGFAPILETSAAHDLPVHIISDGFDYCINRILNSHQRISQMLRTSRICAAHLEVRGTRWRTEFPFFHQTCAHGCATCKPAVMRLLNKTNAPAIFVGDGLSDRYAIESADLVFAKHSLASYCTQQSIEHVPYDDLTDVAGYLDRWITQRAFLKEVSPNQLTA